MAHQSRCKLHMFVKEWPIINEKIRENAENGPLLNI